MITTTLKAMNQTRHLGNSVSTGAYDDGELAALLGEFPNSASNRGCGNQTLSLELMAQILAGGFISSNANAEGDGNESRFN